MAAWIYTMTQWGVCSACWWVWRLYLYKRKVYLCPRADWVYTKRAGGGVMTSVCVHSSPFSGSGIPVAAAAFPQQCTKCANSWSKIVHQKQQICFFLVNYLTNFFYVSELQIVRGNIIWVPSPINDNHNCSAHSDLPQWLGRGTLAS